MIEKIFENVPNIHEINQTAAKLRQLGMKEELQKLAEKICSSKAEYRGISFRETLFPGRWRTSTENVSYCQK